MANGAVLFLQPSGLPGKLESRFEYKEHGVHKTWHQNGRIRTEETFDHGKLLTGIYLDTSGNVLNTIREGTGTRIAFGEPIGGASGRINGIAEYVDGLKHGRESFYADYEKGIKRSEEYFREGKRHGTKTMWMSTGEKNMEEHFKEGKPHGRSLCWHKNGQLQSCQEFNQGNRVGAWTTFFENGTNATEISDDRHRQWLPSGQLMVDKRLGEGGKVTSGVSCDSLGNTNGVVSGGVGILVHGEGYKRFGQYLMAVHEKGKRHAATIRLPRPNVSYGYSSNTVKMTASFEIPQGTWEHGTVSLVLPPEIHANVDPTFRVGKLESGYTTNLGPVTIAFPQDVEEWKGTIMADVNGVVNGHPVRYQHPIFSGIPKMDKPPATPRRRRPPKPYRVSHTSTRRGSKAPCVGDKTMRPYSQAVAHWRLSKRQWLLYRSPALLLISEDNGNSWRIARSDFSYSPVTLQVRSEDSMLLWGTRPTKEVSEGIPYAVEQSTDRGETWQPLNVPKVDFLLGVGGNEKALMVSGSRIPKDGIPPDTDWFELQSITFVSQDGTNFTEIVGPNLFGIEKIKTKSVAPNGKSRAFLSVSSWLDTSYGLYLAKGEDELPLNVISPPAGGDLVWSGNSRILAVRNKDQFVTYVDTTSGDSEKARLAYARTASEKEHSELTAFDEKVRTLILENAK